MADGVSDVPSPPLPAPPHWPGGSSACPLGDDDDGFFVAGETCSSYPAMQWMGALYCSFRVLDLQATIGIDEASDEEQIAPLRAHFKELLAKEDYLEAAVPVVVLCVVLRT